MSAVTESERKEILDELTAFCIDDKNTRDAVYAELDKVVGRFISKANGFLGIKEFSEKTLGKYWNASKEEHYISCNFGWASIFRLALENAMEDLLLLQPPPPPE